MSPQEITRKVEKQSEIERRIAEARLAFENTTEAERVQAWSDLLDRARGAIDKIGTDSQTPESPDYGGYTKSRFKEIHTTEGALILANISLATEVNHNLHPERNGVRYLGIQLAYSHEDHPSVIVPGEHFNLRAEDFIYGPGTEKRQDTIGLFNEVLERFENA